MRTAPNVLVSPLKSLLAVLVAAEFLFVLGSMNSLISCWHVCLSAHRKCWSESNIFLRCLYPSHLCFLRDYPCFNNLGFFGVVSIDSSVSIRRRSMFWVMASPSVGLQELSVIMRYGVLAVETTLQASLVF